MLSLPGGDKCRRRWTGNPDDSTRLTKRYTGNSRQAPTQHGPNTGRDRDRGNGGGYSLSAESRGNGQGLVTLCYVAKGSGEVRSNRASSKSK